MILLIFMEILYCLRIFDWKDMLRFDFTAENWGLRFAAPILFATQLVD